LFKGYYPDKPGISPHSAKNLLRSFFICPQPLIFITKYLTNIMKAIWNNQVIAESDDTIVVENNHYFPADSVKAEYLKPSPVHTTCIWKGKASYYNLEVDGKENLDAAWYYPEPKPAAENIAGRIAFWKGVKVTA
jgi:uncharacterized protein (DUF427 family)